jgi:hypothetical protein
VASFSDAIGQGVAGFFDLPAIRFALTAAGAYVVLVWLACAFWTWRDARRRQDNVVAPYVAAGAVILASPALFPLALLVYRIVRPAETLTEARQHLLEDRLAELDSQAFVRCPDCGDSVEDNWLICPSCRVRLAHRCVECGRSMRVEWSLCAWCGAEVALPAILDAPQASEPATPEPVFQPQREAATA